MQSQASIAAVIAAPLAGEAVLAGVFFFAPLAFGNIDTSLIAW